MKFESKIPRYDQPPLPLGEMIAIIRGEDPEVVRHIALGGDAAGQCGWHNTADVITLAGTAEALARKKVDAELRGVFSVVVPTTAIAEAQRDALLGGLFAAAREAEVRVFVTSELAKSMTGVWDVAEIEQQTVAPETEQGLYALDDVIRHNEVASEQLLAIARAMPDLDETLFTQGA